MTTKFLLKKKPETQLNKNRDGLSKVEVRKHVCFNQHKACQWLTGKIQNPGSEFVLSFPHPPIIQVAKWKLNTETLLCFHHMTDMMKSTPKWSY